jgi:outer membrane receptor for ferrienterochelin and colicins
MHLPVVPNDFRPSISPWFTIMNFQAGKRFNNGFEFYVGAKNILNFIPENPLLRPFDPFDKNITVNNPQGYTFDTTYNYAPVQGIKGFAGIRYTIQ